MRLEIFNSKIWLAEKRSHVFLSFWGYFSIRKPKKKIETFFDFFSEKFNLDYVIDKIYQFCVQEIFFVKCLIEHRSKFAMKEKRKFLYLKHFLRKNCITYSFHVRKSLENSFFSSKTFLLQSCKQLKIIFQKKSE